ncbi:MAG: sugar phosphate isomerase/epimerase family protein [Verrucomicrobiales bacterium]|nr:sugar phosphate isomerase/epimerase [Verrucomicrobiae bacterium]MCP5555376.1 sugar phosphate isomerase/epimerase [Akkermansiaceae bacterium]
MKRRQFMKQSATLATALAAGAVSKATVPGLHVSTNVYPWTTFYKRQGKDWGADLDRALASVAAAGLNGYEPVGQSPGQVRALGPLLKAHGLEMRSLYVNSQLHDPASAKESIAGVLAIAEVARDLGCRIVVTNPSPIRWGSGEDKSDVQLVEQAKNLDLLGAGLRERGLTLAYHNHDAELRQGGREFHHMLTGTSPENVSFCLDSHWVFRGCGDSQVALFDVVRLYGSRIVELHLRQSMDGVWTEDFRGRGDIDHVRLQEELVTLGLQPHLVLEQAVEAKSPNTLEAEEAHRRGQAEVRRVFAGFAAAQ